MPTEEAGELTSPTRRFAEGPWLQPLRWLIMLALLVGLAAWYDLTPRSADAADFAHDVRTGAMEHYQVGSGFELRRFTPLSLFNDDDAQASGMVVLWSTGPFRRYSVSLDQLSFTHPPSLMPAAEAKQFVLANRGAPAAPTRTRLGGSWSERIAAPVTGIAYLALIVVLGRGPQPRRATKWSVFFLYGIPGGLGAFWALLCEAPWSRRAMLLPEPPPGPMPGRWTGGKTLILVIVFSSILAGLFALPVRDHPSVGHGSYRLSNGEHVSG